ncbi:hypothetical protein [Streptomyces sp. NPDC090025]|uniref:hypothetical protein n=1 Tax=Streptomyces sp. NPDC090025 TaxID=3365922 RepID=UPI003833924A
MLFGRDAFFLAGHEGLNGHLRIHRAERLGSVERSPHQGQFAEFVKSRAQLLAGQIQRGRQVEEIGLWMSQNRPVDPCAGFV